MDYKCQRCGADEDIIYHLIPISTFRGRRKTDQDIWLCEECLRLFEQTNTILNPDSKDETES